MSVPQNVQKYALFNDVGGAFTGNILTRKAQMHIWFISDLFPHMNEAWNRSDNIGIDAIFPAYTVVGHVPHGREENQNRVTWTMQCKCGLNDLPDWDSRKIFIVEPWNVCQLDSHLCNSIKRGHSLNTLWCNMYYTINAVYYIYIMHSADSFIQSDLQLHSGYTFSLVCVFPGNRTHNLFRCWRNTLTTEPHRTLNHLTQCESLFNSDLTAPTGQLVQLLPDADLHLFFLRYWIIIKTNNPISRFFDTVLSDTNPQEISTHYVSILFAWNSFHFSACHHLLCSLCANPSELHVRNQTNLHRSLLDLSVLTQLWD